MFKATWMWQYKDILNDIDGYVRFLKNNSVTDLYLQFTRQTKYRELYKPLIKELTNNGITAHATSGAPEWAIDGVHVTSFINAVHEYNASATPEESFCRIHLDIEPHNFQDWSTNQDSYITAWESVVNLYTSLTKIPISASVPFWLVKNHPSFYDFMLSKHEHLSIMAYRDVYEGSNGFSGVFEPNVLAGNNLKLPNKVVGGVELGDTSEGSNLTFYDDGIEAMNKMLDRIRYDYSNNPTFKGIAIHHLSVWRMLDEQVNN